ncbi:MAG: Methyltransferase type 12 [Candidatus Amesbacteria bacterium GW2011_GWB1_47_19]|nr:MAG: Methyltransferase type 12 [Candidatus Amesbacteria bacterium GW2011_GWA1_44_24]KKU31728.1 MAG: methyltransferase type 12 [Candidatus Amesbacteria bacterium GW2011_GWC1_46_24]KKU67641.1 MAG: Methyltransferase type 12 [Candidatus Amesbacteria bacterium GW2011_GWB1_47_19]OGD06491.1 MAG: hypothetical protein A2379_02515 [Candidatus Amesbacteria bacterium RIFOXYB1_FULL_47_13]HBC72894.1 hypothetical protein [Candidatus Amesbacteria bacterium]
MNIYLKIPLTLVQNLTYSLFPGMRTIVEKYITNSYWFGSSHVEYNQKQYIAFRSVINKFTNIENKTILELGPGGSIGFGQLCIKDGAKKYYAVDEGDHLGVTGDQHKEKIEFISIGQNSGYPLKDDSIDIIYSCAVLEHVHDLELCFREMMRVLKKGGFMNHQVDLRDHLIDNENLMFLKFPEFLFKLLCGKTGVYVNRKRYSNYLSLFDNHRLEIIKMGSIMRYKGDLDNNLLNTYTRDDLTILSFNVVLRK